MMVQPEELLLVLSRATPCRALAALVHRKGASRLIRARWSPGTREPAVRWQPLPPDSRYVRLLWAAPIGQPVTIDIVTHRVVLVVDRHLGGPRGHPAACASAWELQGSREFTASDLTVVRMLRPLFEHPLFAPGSPLPTAQGPPPADPASRAVPHQPLPNGFGLTQAEAQILCLLGEGLTAESVARRRGVSVRTIHKHLENAYRKIGCHDRVSAVLFAWRSGLLGVPAPPALVGAAVEPVGVGASPT